MTMPGAERPGLLPWLIGDGMREASRSGARMVACAKPGTRGATWDKSSSEAPAWPPSVTAAWRECDRERPCRSGAGEWLCLAWGGSPAPSFVVGSDS